MKIIKKFALGQMVTNCYLIEVNAKVVLIDAGEGIEKVAKYLDENQIKLDEVWLTHTHCDHIMGLQYLVDNNYCQTIYCPDQEISLLADPSPAGNLAQSIGVDYAFTGEVKKTSEINEENVEIKYISGHSKYSAVYIFTDSETVMSGDTLFRQSIGRYDLAYGNRETLVAGIKEHIMSLSDNYVVHPGHGFKTTVEAERGNQLIYG